MDAIQTGGVVVLALGLIELLKYTIGFIGRKTNGNPTNSNDRVLWMLEQIMRDQVIHTDALKNQTRILERVEDKLKGTR